MKDSKQRKIIILIAFLMVIATTLGFTYAFLSTSISGGKMQKIVVGTLELTLSETNELTISDGVFVSDEEGLKQEGFNFTITNTGNMNAKYSIYLDDLAIDNEANRLEDKYIKFNLVQDGSSILNKSLFHRKIYSSKLSSGASSNFILRLWLNEKMNGDVSGKQFKAKLRIEASQDVGKESTLITAYSANDFHAAEYSSKTTSIVTKNNNIIPETAIASWDISEAGDGKAVAYYEDDGTGAGTYKLTLGGEGGLLANPDMSCYFAGESYDPVLDVYFISFNRVVSMDLTYLDTSNVTNMGGMFVMSESLTTLNLSNFDTSQVTEMGGMFQGCISLTTLNLSNFDTSQVTEMGWMFQDCISLTALDISSFDTSKVENMSYMFAGCAELTTLNLSKFDTSNVIHMSAMFEYCTSLTFLNLNNFDTSNVIDMLWMFNHCIKLTTLNLSNFNTSNVTNMEEMFSYCSSLTELDLSNFNTSKVTNMYAMFEYCTSLTFLNLNNFDTSNVTTMENMFRYSSKLTSITVGLGWGFNFSTNKKNMFDNCGTNEVTYVGLIP